MIFKNRSDAGIKLASQLTYYKNNPMNIVLGIPRGGVVTAYEIAKILGLPLDIIVTRKIGAPGNSELAVGAVAQDGSLYFNDSLMHQMGLTPEHLKNQIQQEKIEIKRRLLAYRGNRPPLNLENKIAILVDDGIATGATMHAAITTCRALSAKKIILAVPVIAADAVKEFKTMTDELVYVHEAKVFWGIGDFYDSFDQVEDLVVKKLLDALNRTY